VKKQDNQQKIWSSAPASEKELIALNKQDLKGITGGMDEVQKGAIIGSSIGTAMGGAIGAMRVGGAKGVAMGVGIGAVGGASVGSIGGTGIKKVRNMRINSRKG
jgi:hypothetical protein